jgi:glycerol-3-phosphate acyltransferase PlsY
MDSVLPILLGYGVGSLPLGYFVANRAKGIDLRRVGSGNVGATNVYRTAGLATALVVVLVDVAKGASSVFFAARLATGAADPVAAGIAAIIGHVYPVWLRFHGGKGVATACGVFWMLAPLATAVSATIFVFVVWSTRYVSLGSIIATAALPPLAWLTDTSVPVVIGALVAAALILQRHRANVARLQQGAERRLSRYHESGPRPE